MATLDASAAVRSTQMAEIRVAPWIATHHLQPVMKVYAIRRLLETPPLPGRAKQYVVVPAVAAYVDELGRAVGDRLVGARLDCADTWARDFFVNGYTSLPQREALLQVAQLPSLRGRSGENSVRELVSLDHLQAGRGYSVPVAMRNGKSDLDSGGNVMCAPPVPGHPLGRLVFGEDASRNMSTDLRAFFDNQLVQASFALDTSWLQVGHIDEHVTFIPWPKGDDRATTSVHGFRVLLPSHAVALRILNLCLPDLPLFRGVAGADALKLLTGVADLTAGAVRAAAPIAGIDAKLAAQLLAARTILMKELGLPPTDILELPVLFHLYGTTPPQAAAIKSGKEMEFLTKALGGSSGGEAVVRHCAYTPNVVNMLVLTNEDGTARLVVPKPFGPSREDGTCAFENYIRVLLRPSANEIVFVDDFLASHINIGEIHCSTFEIRTPASPPPRWWELVPGITATVTSGGSSGGTSPTVSRPVARRQTVQEMLAPNGWLDDEIIRRYYAYLRPHYPPATVAFVDPAISFLILNSNSEAEAAAELSALLVNDAALMLFPVNNNENVERSGGSHWTLIAYYRGAGFFYLDSAGVAASARAQAGHRRLNALFQTAYPLQPVAVPQQANGSDCGVFMLAFSQLLADAMVQQQVPDFSQAPDGNAWRVHIGQQIAVIL